MWAAERERSKRRARRWNAREIKVGVTEVTEFASWCVVGSLVVIAFGLAALDNRLREIGRTLQDLRDDNRAWREKVWNSNRNVGA